MSDAGKPAPAASGGLNGWIEAGIFAVALAVLNISYAVAAQHGAHSVAFIGYAMIFAAVTLLVITGPGPDWRRITLHPLSFGIGGGMILMEIAYYLLLNYASPADGSLLVRINVPLAAVVALLVFGRKIAPLAALGHTIVIAAIGWYIPSLASTNPTLAIVLGTACGCIMTARWFATEFHPWNRAARTIAEKMRLTGLVLLTTSAIFLVVIGALMALVRTGQIPPTSWLPTPTQFLHLPTLALGAFCGAVVLTTMQYFGFSTVVKIGSENFLATTALIPLITIAAQVSAVWLGILAPVPLDWGVLPSMLGVFGGVLLVIFAARHAKPS